jgi:radical SAM family uncharacterized protein
LVKDSRSKGSLRDDVADLLARVTRPGRYVGGEFNVRRKPGGSPLIVLSYPDVYEVGISNPGLQILYTQLADATPARVERAYCPWPDLAALMRARGVPLWTLESFSPVREADLWGFTLQHELTYTNVLEMLDLAGVPLRARDRRADDPIVLGGGPGTANPRPVAPFCDAFFVGEAEGRLDEIVAARGAGGGAAGPPPPRAQRLARLAQVPGVWVPRLQGDEPRRGGDEPRRMGDGRGLEGGDGPASGCGDGGRPVVERQVFMGFAATPPVTEPLVPLVEAVHDRAVVEVMRGCSAGCRFCQAGMWYRPVRERPVALVVESALKALRATGCDEVSLISLSSCDYSGIEEAVRGIREARPDVRISLPSLRLDSAAVSLARLGSEQRGSVTLAPEAGTQALRDAINKRVDGAMFRESVSAVYSSGFTGLKLYFMIGLPGETDADVRAIAAMAREALELGRGLIGGRATLSVAVSSFVPKPQTPFQWEGFAGAPVLLARQRLLREAMPRGVRLNFHDVGASLVENILARGGEDVGDLIEAAWRRGARFDAWREHFDVELWRAAARAKGHDLDDAGSFDEAGLLPWEVVDAHLERRFLLDERELGAAGETTEDCRHGACSSCGACFGEIEMELAR